MASITAFFGLLLIYLLTAPANHSLSIDAYSFARAISVDHFADVPAPRLLLWIFAMQVVYSAAAVVVTEPDPFRLFGFASAIQAALAVTLFAKLLMRDFAVDRKSAWLSAALLGASYGIWRFASEVEVYATATLACVVILLAAFGVDRSVPPRLGRIVALSGLGGIATLIYQPIGLLAGVAIPFYLLSRLPLSQVAIYCTIAGLIVIAGNSAAYLLAANVADTNAVTFVLDAKEVPSPELPDLRTLPKVAYAVGHNLMSMNWSYAFEPFKDFFANAAPRNSFEYEIFAARHAGWMASVGTFTSPAGAILFTAAIATAFRHPAAASFCVREKTLVVWLLAHASMMIALSPEGSEGWILALLPMTALAARRLVAPVVANGRTGVVILLVLVFFVHNGLAGIGILSRENGDYLRRVGGALVEQSGPADLIVTQDWRLQQFLLYSGTSQVLKIDAVGIEDAQRNIDTSLANGGRVLIVDNMAFALAISPALNPELALDIQAATHKYLGTAVRVPISETVGYYEIVPKNSRR